MTAQREPRAASAHDPKHGPESFLGLVAATLALMAQAAYGEDGWYPYVLFGILMLGIALAVRNGRTRRVGMGVLAAVLSAVLLRYMYWLFLWGIPGSIISFFSHDSTQIHW